MTLKICYLNTWANCKREQLLAFIAHEAADIDLFYFSEVMSSERAGLYDTCHADASWVQNVNSRRQLEAVLGDDFAFAYNPNSVTESRRCKRTGQTFHGIAFGNMTAVRRSTCTEVHQQHPIVMHGGVAENGFTVGKKSMDIISLSKDGVTYTTGHKHGLWIKGNTKGNDLLRDEQSRNAARHLADTAACKGTQKVIFGGDFNLDLDTSAIQILEDAGLRNLIREHNITNTRTPEYREWGNDGKSMYADYVMVSDAVSVQQFKVLNTPISDHAALIVSVK